MSYCSICRLSFNPAASVCQHAVTLMSDWCPHYRKSDFQNLYRMNIPNPIIVEKKQICATQNNRMNLEFKGFLFTVLTFSFVSLSHISSVSVTAN